MKGVVIYDTSSGNTKKIAETIVGTLEESGIESDLFYVKDAKKYNAKDYSFLIIGSPTRFGTMSFAVKSFLGKVKSEEWIKSLLQRSTLKIQRTLRNLVPRIRTGAQLKRLQKN